MEDCILITHKIYSQINVFSKNNKINKLQLILLKIIKFVTKVLPKIGFYFPNTPSPEI